MVINIDSWDLPLKRKDEEKDLELFLDDFMDGVVEYQGTTLNEVEIIIDVFKTKNTSGLTKAQLFQGYNMLADYCCGEIIENGYIDKMLYLRRYLQVYEEIDKLRPIENQKTNLYDIIKNIINRM